MSIQQRKHQGGGPKTVLGKQRASRNSRKHGLFGAELVLSPEEKVEFCKLRQKIAKELKPDNPLLELAFEDVVACAWRMKLALRLEQREVAERLAETPENCTMPVERDPAMNFPYRGTLTEVRARQKLLALLTERVIPDGHIPQDFEKPVTEAFGPEFWELLVEWKPVNAILAHFLTMTLEKSQLFHQQDLMDPPTAEQKRRYEETDSTLRHEMILKLIQLEQQHLKLQLDRMGSEAGDGTTAREAGARLDLYLRYRTTARREFYKAIDEYLKIRDALRTRAV